MHHGSKKESFNTIVTCVKAGYKDRMMDVLRGIWIGYNRLVLYVLLWIISDFGLRQDDVTMVDAKASEENVAYKRLDREYV
jgi:hypothetical protein